MSGIIILFESSWTINQPNARFPKNSSSSHMIPHGFPAKPVQIRTCRIKTPCSCNKYWDSHDSHATQTAKLDCLPWSSNNISFHMISAEAPKSRKAKVVKVDSDEEVGCFGQVSSDNPQKQKPDQPQIILSFSSSLYLYKSWVVPPPSNSHHQDYYILSRGSL